jgi:hypothetical protein
LITVVRASFALVASVIGINQVYRSGLEEYMAKSGKERIVPPSKKTDSQAGKALRKGSGIGGRVLADAAAAKRQGVKRPGGK